MDHSKDSLNLKSNCLQSHSNSNLFYVPENERPPNIQRCPSYQENHSQKSVTFRDNFPKAKSGPGIQMGLSSISNHPHNNMRHKPQRQQSLNMCQNYLVMPKYPNCDNSRVNSLHYSPQHGYHPDETFESVNTNVYDDDDNTTTSGSYTIDNNANEDFVELNVAQLKDIFV